MLLPRDEALGDAQVKESLGSVLHIPAGQWLPHPAPTTLQVSALTSQLSPPGMPLLLPQVPQESDRHKGDKLQLPEHPHQEVQEF